MIGGGAPPPTLYSLDEIMLNYSSFHHLKLKSNEWKKYMRGKKHVQGQPPRIINHVHLKFLKKIFKDLITIFILDDFKWLSKERNNCTATGSLERKTESNYDYHNYYSYPIIPYNYWAQ